MQALLCLAFLEDRLLFSSSADLSIKVRDSMISKGWSVFAVSVPKLFLRRSQNIPISVH